MFASLFLVTRMLIAWTVAIIVAGFVWSGLFSGMNRGPGWFFGLLAMLVMVSVLFSTVSHLRRVWLIAGRLDSDILSSRQRRQIEVPFEAGETFDLLDAALRELPRSEEIESARDSLQVSARIRRVDPYANKPPSRFNVFARFAVKRNQVLATVTPRDGTSSITLICGPDADAWTDLFTLDDGTNLENVEAITRAITRRVADRRRGEKAASQQTVTEKELTVAKLSLLHAQVDPHFLYNTLASAQLLTRTDPARADQMLGHLIQYLRRSLPRTEDSLSTLGEELERARAYLEILKIRMGSRLNLQIEVPDELKPLPFPSMMLQTLVENSIKHGLEPKSGGGTVWILARAHDDDVSVTVADDGLGFNAQSSGTGIGLKNVRERLRLAYGAAASFAIVSNFPSGVAATITLPAGTAGAHSHA
ncbi:sensor histidine kinase [Pseudoxanthomonas wuyuanensis]|uniref:sensor histidine kinase n=1 Tax=Pseudoxanthomonas wuyuanensis TaxID=1073196 RepID=UPI001389FA6B|nr:histidine kinase [Pseudoxanthomonas wuyuanensis]KAF1722913.1 sensor histidine kinase [Pseudoxanthomonas wuyuanensis]